MILDISSQLQSLRRQSLRWPQMVRTSSKWLVFVGLTVSLSVGALGCSRNAATEANRAGESAAELSPAEAEAAERAEWDAQMARVKSVLDGMDRAELIGDSATKGPLDADVILLKFSDFECPFCAVAAADMKSFTKIHESDVLYVYKQFPLVTIHEEAMPAAKAAWAAGQQDQFWIYHDGLFAFQDKLGEDYYVDLAKQIGLDIEKFERDRNSPEAQAAIDKDLELAEALGLSGTPTFLMNELLIPGGAPLEFFEEAVIRLKEVPAGE